MKRHNLGRLLSLILALLLVISGVCTFAESDISADTPDASPSESVTETVTEPEAEPETEPETEPEAEPETEPVETHIHQYITTVEIIRKANCTTQGFEKRACECGETTYAYTDVVHASIEENVIKAPTCTEDGEAELICSLCQAIVNAQAPIIKKGHTPKDQCDVEVSELTCETDSIRTYKCKTCGEELPEYQEIVEKATGHLATKWDKVFETCEKPFLIISICGKCDTEMDVTEYPARPAKGHKLGKVITYNEPSCSKAGGNGSYCSNCQEYVLSEVIDPLPHTLEWVTVIEATCEHPGKEIEKCSVCGFEDIESEREIPQETEHSKVIVAVYQEPTCFKDGLGRAECKWCHVLLPFTEGVIEKFHAETSPVAYEGQEPTCTSKGFGKIVCDICGGDVELDVEIDCIAHTPGDAVETPASCTEEGKRVYPCTVCGLEEAFVETIAKIDHEPADEPKEYEATCLENGHVDIVCKFCDFVFDKQETDPALGHRVDESSREKIDPTCEAPGFYIIKCLECGEDTFTDETFDPLGHDTLGATREVFEKPTCDKAGKSGLKCNVCGKYQEVEDVEKIDHAKKETRVIEPPQCNKAGSEAEFCVDCGLQLGDATDIAVVECVSEVAQILLEPTCTEDGIAMLACKWCQTPMGSEPIKGGHKDGDIVVTTEPTCVADGEATLYCSVCNEPIDEHRVIKTDGHKENKTPAVTEATCTAEGKKEYSCEVCGEFLREEPISKRKHTPAEEIIIFDPTCTEEGYIYQLCTVCGEMIDETVERTLDAKGHVKADEWTYVDPTCKDKGKRVFLCTVCGEPAEEEIFEDLEQPAHQPGEYGMITEPTCTQPGLEGIVCAVCGFEIDTYPIPATNHAEQDVEVQIEATCKGPGRYAYTCKLCGVLLEVKEIDPAEHKFEKIDTLIPATCYDTGLAKQYCVWCDKDGGYVSLPIEHVGGDVAATKDATCTEPGVGTLKCALCGFTMSNSVVIAPLGHDFTEIAEDIPPTCISKGSVTYKCARCGELGEPVESDMTGHKFGEEAQDIEPTCEGKGMTAKVCTECGAPNEDGTEIITSEALGHTPSEDVFIFEQSCTEAGYIEQICAVCGARFDKEKTLDASGHTASEIPVVVEPTCTAKGRLDYFCKYGCGRLMNTIETLDMKGHGETIEVITLPATCTENGKAEIRCSVCNELLDTKTLGIEACQPIAIDILRKDDCATQTDGLQRMICRWCDKRMGFEAIPWKHHEVYTTIEPTCTEQGYELVTCVNCDLEIKSDYVDATGHKEKADDRAPTCTEDGYYRTICEVCDIVIEGGEIPATGHDFKETVSYATCEKDGFTTFTCEKCGFVETEAGDPALGHEPEKRVVKEANCTEDGLEQEYCTVCGVVINEVVIEKLGHDMTETLRTKANCEEDEKAEFTCSVCGFVDVQVSEGTSFGSKHNFEAGEKVAPTKETNGYTPYKCTVCELAEEREITKLGFVKETTELLAAPDLTADSVLVLEKDTDVIVSELDDDFYLISYTPDEGEEITGFIAVEYVELYLEEAAAE